MTTTHLRAAFYAMTAITARQSFVSTAVTESGLTTMQALTVCRSATRATMTTTRPVNAAVVLSTATTPITMMTMITPIATGAMRNARTAQFTSTTTSLTLDFASSIGVSREDIDLLLSYGYFVEEIEEMLYQPGVIEEALCEILNECAYDYCGEF